MGPPESSHGTTCARRLPYDTTGKRRAAHSWVGHKGVWRGCDATQVERPGINSIVPCTDRHVQIAMCLHVCACQAGRSMYKSEQHTMCRAVSNKSEGVHFHSHHPIRPAACPAPMQNSDGRQQGQQKSCRIKTSNRLKKSQRGMASPSGTQARPHAPPANTLAHCSAVIRLSQTQLATLAPKAQVLGRNNCSPTAGSAWQRTPAKHLLAYRPTPGQRRENEQLPLGR